MHTVPAGIVGLDVGQHLLRCKEMLVGLQIKHHPGAVALGIGQKLLIFETQRFQRVFLNSIEQNPLNKGFLLVSSDLFQTQACLFWSQLVQQ